MPEYPDIELYRERLTERLVGACLDAFRLYSLFLLRTTNIDKAVFVGATVSSIGRVGKRLVLNFDNGCSQVVHLMVSGRLIWADKTDPLPFKVSKMVLASWRFSTGTLSLQEASTKKRASLHFVPTARLVDLDPGGIDLFSSDLATFQTALQAQRRTLKRALTDPRTFDGIGNAYSDEILFHARLSPVRLTDALSDAEVERLFHAIRDTLAMWKAKLLAEVKGFPKSANVTAFRPDFATHGRFGKPCPTCDKPIQRIVHAENETNYCAHCQNEGRLLADRSLSRLLKDDWPKTLDEMLGYD